MSSQQEKTELYLAQVKTLEILFEKHAISAEQFNKSFTCMTEKMGMASVARDHGLHEKADIETKRDRL